MNRSFRIIQNLLDFFSQLKIAHFVYTRALPSKSSTGSVVRGRKAPTLFLRLEAGPAAKIAFCWLAGDPSATGGGGGGEEPEEAEEQEATRDEEEEVGQSAGGLQFSACFSKRNGLETDTVSVGVDLSRQFLLLWLLAVLATTM